MSLSSTIRLIQSDFKRYALENDAEKSWLRILLANPGLWVLTVYRIRRYAELECRIPIWRQLLILVFTFLSHVLKFMTGIELPVTTQIGAACFFPHIGNIIIHYQARIGDNCTIVSGVTIGLGGRGEQKGVPEIGSQVYIGPGAKLIGPIKIGDYVAVGANAVVIRDVPDHAVVAGVPAKILNTRGSLDLIKYEVKNLQVTDYELSRCKV